MRIDFGEVGTVIELRAGVSFPVCCLDEHIMGTVKTMVLISEMSDSDYEAWADEGFPDVWQFLDKRYSPELVKVLARVRFGEE